MEEKIVKSEINDIHKKISRIDYEVVNLKNDINEIKQTQLQLKIDILNIKNDLEQIKEDIIKLKTNNDGDKKTIKNEYINQILSKIDILKNIIRKNIEEKDEFISPSMMQVEIIENEIKTTGKMSESHFKILNEIYLKQKNKI